MARESGAFDYVDRTPPPPELDAHVQASSRYNDNLPILSGGFFYMVGRDDALLEHNLRSGVQCGCKVHNVQIFARDATGNLLSDDDIADVYCRRLKWPIG